MLLCDVDEGFEVDEDFDVEDVTLGTDKLIDGTGTDTETDTLIDGSETDGTESAVDIVVEVTVDVLAVSQIWLAGSGFKVHG